MTTLELLTQLRRLNVRIWVEGCRVRYSAPKGALSPDLHLEIASHKEDIQQFFQDVQNPVDPSYSQIHSIPKEQSTPLSLAQHRIWFLEQLHPHNRAYNIVVGLSLLGKIHKQAFEQSLDAITQRHEILRTAFPQVQGEPIQVALDSFPLPYRVVDLRSFPESGRITRVSSILQEESQWGFNLAEAPLWRLALIQMADEEHQLVLVMHHMISDGWSVRQFFLDFAMFYQSYTTGKMDIVSDPLPIQYRDYVHWQRQLLKSERIERQLEYWKNQFQNYSGGIDLPTVRPRPAVQSFEGSQELLNIPRNLTERLKRFSLQEGCTVFMTLLTIFQIVLHRYSGKDDVVIGTPMAGRNHKETENLIGLFVNTLPLRTIFSGQPTFRQLLHNVRQTVIEGQANQDVPFEKIVEAVNPERSLSQSPLFQVMFVFEQQIENAWTSNLDMRMTPLTIQSRASKFDLTLFLEESRNGISGAIEYSTDLFEKDGILRMIGHFCYVLEYVLDSPDYPVSKLPILTAGEQHTLLNEWNETDQYSSDDWCLHELFEQQADRSPESIALVCGEFSLTFKELNGRANQLAKDLIANGVNTETLVGLCLERSFDMVIACLGILKAGGAFVPLDPLQPNERLVTIAEDAQLSIVVSHEKHRHKFQGLDSQIICLDAQIKVGVFEGAENLPRQVNPENLAYVLYTSGTTGTPKGVMVEHRSIVNYLSWCLAFYPVQEGIGAPLHSSLSFDLSLTSLFVPLLSGNSVILFPEDPSAADLPSLWEDQEPLSFLKVTPSQLQMVNVQLSRGKLPPRIQALILGGEAVDRETVQPWFELVPGIRIFNEYGPTETVVGCCVYELSSEDPFDGPIPIGRPIANTKLYILDHNLQPVPIGVPGELYIGGRGVARGYINQRELTQERFISSPFSSKSGDRLYRTGDRARYLSNGNIEFIGRLDRQCKVRGYRIEPGEIEEIIKQKADVQEVAVVVREDRPGDKQLVAYCVPNCRETYDSHALKSALRKVLPEHLIPSTFVELNNMPLGRSGKVDYSKLPKPNCKVSEQERIFVPPSDEMELQLSNIWESVLGISPISITDNFFDLGGHSLLLIKVVEAMEKIFEKPLSLSIVFEAPTIEQLAGLLRSNGYTPSWTSLVPIQPGGSKPPFFCVHEGTGDVVYYRDLAQCLGPDQPFYGIQPVGLDGLTPPHQTMEEMVEFYIQEVKRLQPRGPYYLGGLCFGAYIALEMARTLQSMGEKVGLLVCFDTFGGQIVRKMRMGTTSSPKKWKTIKGGISTLVNAIRFLTRVVKNRGETQELPSKLQSLLQFMIRIVSKVYLKLGVPLPVKLRRLRVWEAILCARKRYYPGVYMGGMTLFQATPEWKGFTDPADTWTESVLGGVKVHPISGNHISILKQPHVQFLARKLSQCLDQAVADHQSSI